MGKLAGSLCYLCGAVDRVPDGGAAWRVNFTQILDKFGVISLNPLIKPINGHHEDETTRKLRTAAQLVGDFDYLLRDKNVRDIDLQMVHLANFLIVYLDVDEHPFGTVEETVVANQANKPILVLAKQKKTGCPQWLIWMLGGVETIFDTESELVAYIQGLDDGTIVNNKLVLLNLKRS